MQSTHFALQGEQAVPFRNVPVAHVVQTSGVAGSQEAQLELQQVEPPMRVYPEMQFWQFVLVLLHWRHCELQGEQAVPFTYCPAIHDVQVSGVVGSHEAQLELQQV